MATVLDQTYNESNKDDNVNLRDVSGDTKWAQQFAPSVSAKNNQWKFYLKKIGSPTGNIFVQIYADSGDSPTGSALGQSDNVDVSTISGAGFVLVTFTFTTSVQLTSGTKYWAALAGDFTINASNYVQIGDDSSSPSYTYSRFASYNGTSWSVFSGFVAAFYEYYDDTTVGSPSPSISVSLSPSVSPSISVSLSPSVSVSLSPSVSVSLSPSISVSLSASLTPSISESLSPSISVSLSPSVSASLSPSLSPSFSPSTSVSSSVSLSSSISVSLSTSPSPSISESLSPSISVSLSPSLSPSVSLSRSPSPSPSPSPSLSTSLSPSISVSPSPAGPGNVYSREANGSLPTDKTDLSTIYTTREEYDVYELDSNKVDLTGATGNYLLHLFKKLNDNNSDYIKVKVRLKSTLAPSNTTVYLQYYCNRCLQWTTIDSNSLKDSSTYLELHYFERTNHKNYYDFGNEVALRVYQQNASGSSQVLTVERVEILFERSYESEYADVSTSYSSQYPSKNSQEN